MTCVARASLEFCKQAIDRAVSVTVVVGRFGLGIPVSRSHTASFHLCSVRVCASLLVVFTGLEEVCPRKEEGQER